jgi:hypothetical protein
MYGRAYLLSLYKRSNQPQFLCRCLGGRGGLRRSFKNWTIAQYLRYGRSYSSYLHLLCSTFTVRTANRHHYRRIKGRFARFSKPVDHLGDFNPEGRINVMQIGEELPRAGATLEDMDIFIG